LCYYKKILFIFLFRQFVMLLMYEVKFYLNKETLMFIFRKIRLLGAMITLFACFQIRAEVTFTPAEPVVAMEEKITLSVSGTVGDVKWSAQKGWIETTGTTVIYIAPSQSGWDVVTVIDAQANIATVKIQINEKQDFSYQHGIWKVFTNRDSIRAFALSKDKTTLWIGTDGGLEKRNTSTGELEKIYTTADGLPSSRVEILISDDQGGVWLKTFRGGLTHLKANDSWQVFNEDNSDLPDNDVTALLSDSYGGVWIKTSDGSFAHLKANGFWQVFNKRNSDLPSDGIEAILSDNQGGVWAGTAGGGLIHLRYDGFWRVFNTANSNLPHNTVIALSLDDEQGGVWIGTDYGGLAHLKADGSWQIFNKDNSELPSDRINVLCSDEQGGIWVGTTEGLSHLKADGSWQVFNKDNSNLPFNYVEALFLDSQGGVWLGASGIAHLKADGSWQVFNADNSNLPSDNIEALFSDRQGGVWVVTDNDSSGRFGGIAHLKVDGSGYWQILKNTSNLPSNYIRSLLSDNQGGVWVGTESSGLAHLRDDGSWQIFDTDNSNLPSNRIRVLLSDNQGGVWVGTEYSGLAHLKADGSWQIFDPNLPSNRIRTLLSDEQGGVWVTTDYGGIAHLKADSSWQVFDIDNLILPYGQIRYLLSDNQGGVWITTTDYGGLAHLKADGSWQFFDTDNSNLPSNGVNVLLSDEQGRVWIGLSDLDREDFRVGGLAHLKADGSWQIFNKDNSELPHNWVETLIADDKGGVWIGTLGGLAHLKDDAWQVFNKDNSNLPSDSIQSFLSDGQGGIWVRTPYSFIHLIADDSWQVFNEDNLILFEFDNSVNALISDEQGGLWIASSDPDEEDFLIGGLVYLKADGSWQVFKTNNSNLPDNWINALISDEQGGVWIGTDGGGLAHLTLGEQQSGKRAAIIIAGGGNQATNALWDTTESISTYFYKMLIKRKFVNSEIYYLSSHPWADFNGDGYNDRIVDAPRPPRPITVDDVKKAFDWAKEQGKLDQPLYLFFIDHGGEGKLQLAKNTMMQAAEFKAMLDDYQNATGNQVVVLLEACYSGSFLPILAAPNRAIISSAKANELAYFEDKQGFSRFFTKNMLKGMNFLEAFEYAVQKQSRMLAKMDERLSGGSEEYIATTQTPQCDDNGDGVYNESDGAWLKQLRINGNIRTADFTLAVESLTTSISVQVGEPFQLRAKATTASGLIKRVWAVIRPPRINLVIDSNGTPILAYPTLELSQSEDKEIWTGTWNEAVYSGDYEISFYAKDNEGNIEMSEESVVISVTGGAETPAEASVEIVIDKESYARGESFQFGLVEQLGWGYDLYAAVVLPDGQFITLEGSNKFAQINKAENWRNQRKYNEKVSAIDMTLPANLATGTYCLYGILSPQGEVPLAVMDKWVSSQKCFEVF
jgi:ligand-binding sensor domain-containing protein